MIPYENLALSNKSFEPKLKEAFDLFIKDGRYILGDKLLQFEKDFSIYQKNQFCIGVGNGLDALILSLKALNLEIGSEVIVPSNTFIATILAVLQVGLIPVLVEPRIDTYNINPDNIEEEITKKTKCIIPVHLYGKCCEMDKIKKIASKHELFIIEDAAQSHGARYKNQLSGTLGDLSCFSFYPTKNLGGFGDGGAICTYNLDFNNQLRSLRNYGSSKKYFNDVIGFNSRLDDLQACLLGTKLPFLEKMNAHRRKLAQMYKNELKADFITPVFSGDYIDVFHIFNIRHPQRDSLKEYLLKNEIGTEIHYPVPPNYQKALKDIFGNRCYPLSEEIHRTTLSLPCSVCHTENDIHRVIEVLNKF